MTKYRRWAISQASDVWHAIAEFDGRFEARCKYNQRVDLRDIRDAPPTGARTCGKCEEGLRADVRNLADEEED